MGIHVQVFSLAIEVQYSGMGIQVWLLVIGFSIHFQVFSLGIQVWALVIGAFMFRYYSHWVLRFITQVWVFRFGYQ